MTPDKRAKIQAAKIEAEELRAKGRSEAHIRAVLIGNGHDEAIAYEVVGPIEDSGT